MIVATGSAVLAALDRAIQAQEKRPSSAPIGTSREFAGTLSASGGKRTFEVHVEVTEITPIAKPKTGKKEK